MSFSVSFETYRILPDKVCATTPGHYRNKTNARTEEEAEAAEAAGKAEWATIYSGEIPRAEVRLSEPTSLYVFRTVRPAGVSPDGNTYEVGQ